MGIKDTQVRFTAGVNTGNKKNPLWQNFFPYTLLKNYPVSYKINVYTTKYFCVIIMTISKAGTIPTNKWCLQRARAPCNLIFVILYEWNPLRLGWNCILQRKEQHTHHSCTSGNKWSMLTKILYIAKLKHSCIELFGGYRRKFWKFKNYNYFWQSWWLKQPQ